MTVQKSAMRESGSLVYNNTDVQASDSSCFRPTAHRVISPFHVPSVRPSVSMQCVHLGPPLSFLLKYASSFCLLCTSSLRFLLLTLSIFPLVAKKSASVRIFAVKIPICTSLLPVSGPALGVFVGCSIAGTTAVGARGSNCLSVSCRPKVEMHRWMLTRSRSFDEPFASDAILFIASVALMCPCSAYSIRFRSSM